jgi:hypothetical protein
MTPALAGRPLPPPFPLPRAAVRAVALGPAVTADDACVAAPPGADPENGSKYHRARYHDPKVGRLSARTRSVSGGAELLLRSWLPLA